MIWDREHMIRYIKDKIVVERYNNENAKVPENIDSLMFCDVCEYIDKKCCWWDWETAAQDELYWKSRKRDIKKYFHFLFDVHDKFRWMFKLPILMRDIDLVEFVYNIILENE